MSCVCVFVRSYVRSYVYLFVIIVIIVIVVEGGYCIMNNNRINLIFWWECLYILFFNKI